MCLAIPGKLVEITAELDNTFRLGKVSFGGIMKDVNLALVPEAEPGVTTPSFLKVDLSFAMDSIVASERQFSSFSVTLFLPSMGTISP